jgi:uncharacterized membrane protein (DUF2068 family)
MTVQTRPPGLTLLAVMVAVAGVVTLLAGIAYMIVGGAVGATTALGGLGSVLAVLLLLTGIVDLAFAYGAWTLKPWGWPLGLIGAGLMIVTAVLRIVDNPSSAIISIAISAAIVYYLNTSAVKAAFGRA